MTSVVNINLSKIPGFHSLVKDYFSDESTNTNILKLNKVHCTIEKTDNDNKYKVIGYDKKLLGVDMYSTYGLCRSIIINSENKVVCFSPPKSIPYNTFIESNYENVVAREFVEGTMVNVFWEENNGLTGSWEISTRNTVGATSSFYRNNTSYKTFREMFLEAAQYTNLDVDLLDKNYCYSFVLQHPSNRIVVPFDYPMLYLAAVYKITNEDDNIIVTVTDLEDIKKSGCLSKTCVKFPEIYSYTTYSELVEKYASHDTPYTILGFVLYNRETGERSKVRNPVYEQVRLLRGNQPKPQYHYLCLRRENKVTPFLEYFPEYKQCFSEYRKQIHLFTNTLFSNYISCYVKKEKKLLDFSPQYRTHMFNLHQKYKEELKELNLYITKSVVIHYVNEIHPTLLMYCLNFPLRNSEFVK